MFNVDATAQPSPPARKPRILAVMLEFDSWATARPWSYSASYALLDGFAANGCETVVLPSLNTGTTANGINRSNPWVEARDRIVGNGTFDQAWVWITHSYYSDEFWSWLEAIAPVRVGVLMESLRYSADEIANASPHLALRREAVLSDVRHTTHVLSADECDVADIERETGLPARQYHSMLPRDLVSQLDAPGGNHAVFLGSLYPMRAQFLAQTRLATPLVVAPPPENATNLPARFDETHDRYRRELSRTGGSPELAQAFIQSLRDTRRQALQMVYDVYRSGFASVNLPALFKGFTGRVLETMAAAVPLVTPRPEHRPRTEALFSDGNDLLYYDGNRPDDFGRQLQRLAADAQLQVHLVRSARRTVLDRMSADVQIAQSLAWIEETRAKPAGKPASTVSAADDSAAVSQTLQTLFGPEPFFGHNHAFGADAGHHVRLVAALAAALRSTRPARVVEVGSLAGASTLALARGIEQLSPLGGSIVCVDAWEIDRPAAEPADGRARSAAEKLLGVGIAFDLFLHNVAARPANVQLDIQRGRSASVLPALEAGAFDLVYLDGSTRYADVSTDLVNAARLLREGGILCGTSLEAQLGEFDIAHADANRERGLVTDPRTGRSYHAGVSLAIYEFHRRHIAQTAGFWAVRKTGNRFEDLTPARDRSIQTNFVLEQLAERPRDVLRNGSV